MARGFFEAPMTATDFGIMTDCIEATVAVSSRASSFFSTCLVSAMRKVM